MQNRNLASLQEYVETCFKREGLYAVLPDDRRESIVTIPLASIWFVLLWAIQVILILRATHYEGWIFALFFLPMVLGACCVCIAIYFLVKHFREFLHGKPNLSVYNTHVGVFFCLIFPLVLIVSTGLYLRSFRTSLYHLSFSVGALFCAFVLYAQRSKVRLLIEFFRSGVRVLGRSVGLIFVFLPVLLVIVMLSVFSSDLWAALGDLSYVRIVAGTAVIITPAFLLMFASLKEESGKVIGAFPTTQEIVSTVERYPLIENALKRGLISVEEWAEARAEVAWRHPSRLADKFLGSIQTKVRHWLVLLLILTSVLVMATFLVYFFVLFRILLQPGVIAEWVGSQVVTTRHVLSVAGTVVSIETYSTDTHIIKVSWLLSVFVALASTVYALTDESASDKLTAWLSERAKTWLSLACLYDGVLCRGYQIWRYTRRDKKRGLVNVTIVVPQESTDEDVKRACIALDARLFSFKNLVYITAFPKNTKNLVYETWMPGKRWQLINNKAKNYQSFDVLDIPDDDISSNYFLGVESSENGSPIPDEWFGLGKPAVELSREIWDSDKEGLVLQPYVVATQRAAFVTVRVRKRMPNSADYKQFVKHLFNRTHAKLKEAPGITITVTYRETEETVASLWWHTSLPTVTYKDELKGQKTEKASYWLS